MALFEGYERRIDQINAVLNSYGISSIEEAEKITKDAGLDVYEQVKKIQPICFENACWAYTVGAAIAIKKGCTKAADAAEAVTLHYALEAFSFRDPGHVHPVLFREEFYGQRVAEIHFGHTLEFSHLALGGSAGFLEVT